ncbi:DUF3276 family protein [Pedobacter sp.]|uniref:DUF3276 family protein n=1 Tax=Pedobacter sp. TaxID=1411316 RepID=UPI003BACC1EE
MKNKTIASEMFSSGDKYYFVDLKKAVNNTCYIRITRSDESKSKRYKRASVVIFEEDFEPFIQALASLLHHGRFSILDDTTFKSQ